MLHRLGIAVVALAFSYAAFCDELLTPEEQRFLSQHWPDIIPLQGEAPAAYSELERSLAPSACGTCHPRQYQDWQSSLHSRTMGPGVLGQLLDMIDDDPATVRMCGSCHTPLAEQQAVLADATGLQGGFHGNPAFDPSLQRQGLVCAVCHVRQHQRYGPPRLGSPEVTGRIDADLPHGGFTAESAFTKSAFCSGCHQFAADDYALNGKLIENTYEEWKASRYPAQGVQCQTCHMPGRRHVWRGIHDPEMVRQGVTVSVEFRQRPRRPGERVQATVTVANTGTGHYFPTYMTPKIFVRGYLVDAQGETCPDTFQEAVIGRDATPDLSREIYDTRIPPGSSLAITYDEVVREDGLQLKVEIVVYPDHFYTRFYENYLASAQKGKGRELIEEALAHTRKTAFTLYEKTFPLAAGADEPAPPAASPPASPSPLSKRPGTPGNGKPDWNEADIRWYDYDQGLEAAAALGKPVLMIFYADWCPTCHAYGRLFRDRRVIETARDFIMIRVDAERAAELNRRFALDGDYVPRTFVLDRQGRLRDTLYEGRTYPRYFLSAEDPRDFLALMRRALD